MMIRMKFVLSVIAFSAITIFGWSFEILTDQEMKAIMGGASEEEKCQFYICNPYPMQGTNNCMPYVPQPGPERCGVCERLTGVYWKCIAGDINCKEGTGNPVNCGRYFLGTCVTWHSECLAVSSCIPGEVSQYVCGWGAPNCYEWE